MRLENEERIPLSKSFSTEDAWIEYKGRVFLIRTDIAGTGAQYQYNGVVCNQGYIKGYVYASFESKAKYFNPEFWYKKTTWGKDFPKKILFTDDSEGEKLFKYSPWAYKNVIESKWRERVEAHADKHARPSENILSNIIQTSIKRTGINMSFPFEDMNYGTNWWEAKVPVKFGDKLEYDGLLTWENCD